MDDILMLGIDIGGTYTKVGLVNREGELLGFRTFPSHAQGEFTEFLRTFRKNFLQLMDEVPEGMRVVAAGIGAPNANPYRGTMEYPVNFTWGDRVPLLEQIQPIVGMPVFLTNDANASALGEWRFGLAKGLEHFIVVTLGTGLGSGIVSHGRLIEGTSGLAGEMGHVEVRPDGRQCICGKRGCLETYASASGLKRTAFKLMADEPIPSVLRSYAFEQLDGKIITEAALEGDPLAQRAFAYTGYVLGSKLADAVAYFHPQVIILSGGLAKAGNLLLKPTLDSMEHHLKPGFRKSVRLLISEMHGANAAVLGAAALAWERAEIPVAES